EARRDLAAWLAKWSGKYSKLTGWVEDNIDETLTFYRLPRQHHKHLKSTNMLERLNGRPRHLGDARDDPAMGPQIRPGFRQPDPSASASPWRQMAPRWCVTNTLLKEGGWGG